LSIAHLLLSIAFFPQSQQLKLDDRSHANKSMAAALSSSNNDDGVTYWLSVYATHPYKLRATWTADSKRFGAATLADAVGTLSTSAAQYQSTSSLHAHVGGGGARTAMSAPSLTRSVRRELFARIDQYRGDVQKRRELHARCKQIRDQRNARATHKSPFIHSKQNSLAQLTSAIDTDDNNNDIVEESKTKDRSVDPVGQSFVTPQSGRRPHRLTGPTPPHTHAHTSRVHAHHRQSSSHRPLRPDPPSRMDQQPPRRLHLKQSKSFAQGISLDITRPNTADKLMLSPSKVPAAAASHKMVSIDEEQKSNNNMDTITSLSVSAATSSAMVSSSSMLDQSLNGTMTLSVTQSMLPVIASTTLSSNDSEREPFPHLQEDILDEPLSATSKLESPYRLPHPPSRPTFPTSPSLLSTPHSSSAATSTQLPQLSPNHSSANGTDSSSLLSQNDQSDDISSKAANGRRRTVPLRVARLPSSPLQLPSTNTTTNGTTNNSRRRSGKLGSPTQSHDPKASGVGRRFARMNSHETGISSSGGNDSNGTIPTTVTTTSPPSVRSTIATNNGPNNNSGSANARRRARRAILGTYNGAAVGEDTIRDDSHDNTSSHNIDPGSPPQVFRRAALGDGGDGDDSGSSQASLTSQMTTISTTQSSTNNTNTVVAMPSIASAELTAWAKQKKTVTLDEARRLLLMTDEAREAEFGRRVALPTTLPSSRPLPLTIPQQTSNSSSTTDGIDHGDEINVNGISCSITNRVK
jgi:hypothetical protein